MAKMLDRARQRQLQHSPSQPQHYTDRPVSPPYEPNLALQHIVNTNDRHISEPPGGGFPTGGRQLLPSPSVTEASKKQEKGE